MHFGVAFANVFTFAEPEAARAIATTAEELGFESLWTVEHVVVPAGYESPYPYSPDGKMPAPDDTPLPDPLVWLAFAAASTSRIKLGTGIAILPQRNALIAAKEVATVDRLSGGRVLLGVGAGWLKEEFEALGVPFERRGRRLDEHIEAMRALWAGERAAGCPSTSAATPISQRGGPGASVTASSPAPRTPSTWPTSSGSCAGRRRRRGATPTPSRSPPAGRSTPTASVASAISVCTG
jgi:alkanesulfonate monooxygenase SsuD/methylene tetrahydromethanopterin reductase-like flavin-dependent oxidoreductase (luciferase family)